ncbi:MAG: PAS domain S-box protein [Lentisphaeria bacterium]|nr:PAS domain S-box protein [Candidatus Neomarinimicrobiota bacterium]MCF7842856.1 PAS domain S-box protein [Lentisphaeria bacterium]
MVSQEQETGIQIPQNSTTTTGELIRNSWIYLLIFFTLSAVIIITGKQYYDQYEQYLKLNAAEELTLTATFKSSEIATWYHERQGDANVLHRDTELIRLVRQALISPPESSQRQRLIQRLNDIQSIYHYAQVVILDQKRQMLNPTTDGFTLVDEILQDSLSVLFNRGHITTWSIHKHDSGGKPHLSIIIPLIDTDSSKKPFALLVLIMLPERNIYPLLNFWPIKTRSAESLLVQRNNNVVTFLSQLRFDSSAILDREIPLHETDIPAIMAVTGERGLVEGVDYRGERVMAYLLDVPETPWYLVAKIDESEILEPLQQRLTLVIFQVSALILALGLGLALLWRHRRAAYYKKQLELSEKLRSAQESATTLLRSIGDAVIATDRQGKIIQINPVAEKLTGWKEEEALGQSLSEVFRIVHHKTRKPLRNPVQNVLTSNKIVELANHTILLNRAGEAYHIADSAAPIRTPKGDIEGVILTFRDETEKYQAQEKVLESQRQLSVLINNLPGLVYHCDNDPDWTMIYVSEGVQSLTGYAPREFTETRTIAFGDLIHPDDRAYVWNTIQASLAEKKSYTITYRIITVNGDERWVWERGSGIFNDQDELQRLEGFITDITAEKIAEDAIRASEERYRLIWDSTKDGMRLTDGDGTVVEVNQAFCEMVGLAKSEVEGQPLSVMYGKDHDRIIRKHQERFQNHTIPERHTRELELHNGENRWFEISNAYVQFHDKPEYVLCVFRDITKRKRAEELRQTIENQYRQLYNSLRDAILVADTSRMIIDCNPAFSELFGYSLEEIKGHPTVKVYQNPDEFETMGAELRKHMDELGFVTTIHYKKKSGDSFVGETSAQYIRDSKGNVTGFLALIRDVTEREELLAELRHSEEHNRDLIEHSQDLICTHALDGRLLSVNPAVVRQLEYAESELLKMNLKDAIVPKYRDDWDDYINTIVEHGHAEGLMAVQSKSGERYIWEYRNTLRTDGVSEPIVRGVARDITRQKQMEMSLRESEERFRTLYENTTIGLYRSTPGGRILMANPTLVKMLGFESFEELAKIDLKEEGFSPTYPRDEFVRKIETEGAVSGLESHWIRQDGSTIFVRESARVVRDEQGNSLYYDGSVEDITDRKLLETQLMQAQKMESIGRLAGGIAHDFNNMLSIINGYSELLMMELPPSSDILPKIKDIHDAGRRAASLTQHLLAFSRKQILEMRVVNINSILSDTEKLLRKIIGEDIDLVFNAGADIWPAKIDTGQFEQVILNLALNARDAMPTGGKLTVETQNVTLEEDYSHLHYAIPAGEYVRIAVSDTGTGMEPEIMEKVFEPFFTTKEKGKGTGLGLATVFGIIKQSEGFINAYSEPGAGTTFKIYLPRVRDKIQKRTIKRNTHMKVGTETILLVEDEEKVREIARLILESAGYTALVAESAPMAVEWLRDEAQTIDLLLTDVVMPEMSGKELGKIARDARPDLPVLYMSGYTDNAIVQHGVLDEGVHFIGKPFSPVELTRKVRGVLDGLA